MSGRWASACFGDFRLQGRKMVRAPKWAPGLMGWVPIPLSTGREKLGVASRIKWTWIPPTPCHLLRLRPGMGSDLLMTRCGKLHFPRTAVAASLPASYTVTLLSLLGEFRFSHKRWYCVSFWKLSHLEPSHHGLRKPRPPGNYSPSQDQLFNWQDPVQNENAGLLFKI